MPGALLEPARALSYEHSGLPTCVVYATQFHNLVADIFSACAKVGVIPAFRGVSFQPMSTTDVVRVTAMPLPGSGLTFLRLGENLIPEHAVGFVSFADWLRARNQSG